jgi:hypothetical protein
MSLFNLEAAGGWAELNSILMNVPTRDPNDDEDDATGDEDIEDEQDDDEPAVVRDPDDSPRAARLHSTRGRCH